MAADTKDGSLGDGSLDVKEYLSFSYPQEDPAMRALVLAQVIFHAYIWNAQLPSPPTKSCMLLCSFYLIIFRMHVLVNSCQVLKEKDTDGNGRLSFEEYVGKRDQEKDESEKKKRLDLP